MAKPIPDSVAPLQDPYNLEAEQAVLGHLLMRNDTLDKIDGLSAEDFAAPEHQHVYSYIAKLIAEGSVADGVTLKAELTRAGLLDAIGGGAFIMRLMASAAPVSEQALAYVQIVRDLAQRRAVIRAAQDATALALHPPPDMTVAEITIKAQRGFDAIAHGDSKPKTLGEAAADFVDSLDQPVRQAIPTGYAKVDKRLGGGLFRGDLIIIAGRPSMGKSSVANNIVRNVSRAGGKVGLFSAEMHAESIAMRAMAAHQYNATDFGFERFAYAHLRNGAPGVNRQHMRAAADALGKMPFLIDDRAGLSVEEIEWSARAMRRMLGGLDLVVVDYLQILQRPYRQGANDAAIIGMMTQAFKIMARTLGVAMIVVSQLSRQLESREDKRPMLSDLRESGAIEQDADVVAAVYREAYYLERSEPRVEDGGEKLAKWTERMALVRDTIEFITLKQRNGPVGTDVLRALMAYDLILNTP